MALKSSHGHLSTECPQPSHTGFASVQKHPTSVCTAGVPWPSPVPPQSEGRLPQPKGARTTAPALGKGKAFIAEVTRGEMGGVAQTCPASRGGLSSIYRWGGLCVFREVT